jgi:diguanylate cyclase (GGDEF)-like protein/PAS domain S-box-containing protein
VKATGANAAMNALLDALDCGLLLLDGEGRVVQANRWLQDRCAAPVALGRPLAEAFGAEPVEPRLLRAVADCLVRGNAARLSQAFHPRPLPLFPEASVGEEAPQDADAVEAGAPRAPPRLRQAVDVVPVEEPPGGARHCLLQVRDVSETVRREQTLRSQALQLSTEVLKLTEAQREIERQSQRFSEIARLAPVGLLETGHGGRLVFSNARASELLGVPADPFMGQPWTAWLTAAGHAPTEALQAAERPAFEFRLEAHGPPRWLRLEGTPLANDGQTGGHLFTLVDVTELREQARRNEMRANHDALTGLANRTRFEQRLAEVAERCQAGGQGATLLFIDLDRFKAVNDTLGHPAGDAVLQAVARRLRRCLRAEDLVARLGGDEFAVLLDGLTDEAVVQRIVRTLEDAVRAPVAVGDTTASVGASIGTATLAPGAADAAAALALADAAMYRAKRSRRAVAAA